MKIVCLIFLLMQCLFFVESTSIKWNHKTYLTNTVNNSRPIKLGTKLNRKTLRIIKRCARSSFNTSKLCRRFSVNSFKNFLFYWCILYILLILVKKRREDKLAKKKIYIFVLQLLVQLLNIRIIENPYYWKLIILILINVLTQLLK